MFLSILTRVWEGAQDGSVRKEGRTSLIWVLIKVQENIWIYKMEEVSQATEIPGTDSYYPFPCMPCSESPGLLWSEGV